MNMERIVQQIVDRLEASESELRQRQAHDLNERLLPELASALPSASIVKFEPPADDCLLPAGTSLVAAKEGSVWRMADEVHLHGFDVTECTIGPGSDWAPLPKGTRGILRLHVSATNDDEASCPNKLRFHLVGEHSVSFALFQMLCCSLVAAYARDESGSAVPIACEPVEYSNSLFATPKGLPPESRFLSDFFFCPERFTAFDLGNFPISKGEIEVVLAFAAQLPELPVGLIQTRCATIINEVVRELPMIEVTPMRDEWELSEEEDEQVHSLVRVEVYDRDSGRWTDCKGCHLVTRNGRARIAFRTPLFEPTDPPSRFVKVVARCFQQNACLNRGDVVESEEAERAHVLRRTSSRIIPHHSLSRWTASGFREPLTNESFQRMLLQQALLDKKFVSEDEFSRQAAVRKMLSGTNLLSVTTDRYASQGEVFHGRRVTIAIDPLQFPGGAYWVFVRVIARFLAAYSPFHQFTRLALRVGSKGVDKLLPPMFGRRDSA